MNKHNQNIFKFSLVINYIKLFHLKYMLIQSFIPIIF